MNGALKSVLQVVFLIALIWVLAWITGGSASVSVPGGYARVGKGRGCGCRGPRRVRSFRQVVTGMIDGEYVNDSSSDSMPAGQPMSVF